MCSSVGCPVDIFVVTARGEHFYREARLTDPGWEPDPTGRHQYRYFDGAAWTDHVADGDAAVD